MLIKCGKCNSYFKWCDIGVKWLCEKKKKKKKISKSLKHFTSKQMEPKCTQIEVHMPRQRESGRETAQQMIINHMKLQL
jgi:hypothetical protein